MASKSSREEQAGATPAKLALIGVLGVVLIVILYVQFGRTSEQLPPVAADAPSARQPDVGRPEAGRKLDQEVAAVLRDGINTTGFDKWRPPDLAAVVQHDPFALPAAFPQPRQIDAEGALAELSDQGEEAVASLEQQVQQSRAELETLRHLGVQVVIRQSDGYVAMIGDRTIRVGDEINGFTVIAIDSDGVRVARDLKP